MCSKSVASFPVPRPAFRRLQYGKGLPALPYGTGNEASKSGHQTFILGSIYPSVQQSLEFSQLLTNQQGYILSNPTPLHNMHSEVKVFGHKVQLTRSTRELRQYRVSKHNRVMAIESATCSCTHTRFGYLLL